MPKATINKSKICAKFLVYIPLFITSFLFGVATKAQHCQYDFLGIVGVVPFDSDTSKIIDGLYITLVDSIGNPIIERQIIYDEKDKAIGEKDTSLIFWRNPIQNKDVNHTSNNLKTRHFYFANNHYILVLNHNYVEKLIYEAEKTPTRIVQKFYLKIEDKDSVENGGYFNTMILTVSPEYYLPLCRVPLKKGKSIPDYKPLFVETTKYQYVDLQPLDKGVPYSYSAPYDSMSVTLDSLQYEEGNGEFARQLQTTTFYKRINGEMIIIERRDCLTQSWDSEHVDCWIYHLINGELVNDEFQQGED